LRRKRCGKTAAPRCILRYACNAVAAVRALCTKVRLRRIGLHKLLSRQSALLTCITYLFTSLGPLRRRKTSQFAVFATLQGTLRAQLLRCIELPLPLRLQICPGLCIRYVRPCLRGRRQLTLAFCAKLLSLRVPFSLSMSLLLLNATVDHCRGPLALGRRDVGPSGVRRGRPGKTWRRCRRPCHLRP
jgi:hypothetical protein